MTSTFDWEALERLIASPGKADDATLTRFADALDDSLTRSAIICSVPSLLNDELAWSLLKVFHQSNGDTSTTFFQLKGQPFVQHRGSNEWCLWPSARKIFLRRISKSEQMAIHRAVLDWLDLHLRLRADVDDRLVDLYCTYHVTAQDETDGLARWRLHSRALGLNGHDGVAVQFAVADLTNELQELGWISQSRLEPQCFRGLYLYSTGRSVEAAPIFAAISDTERREWAVAVAKHLLANLVMRGAASSKEAVHPIRYAEGLLWRSLDIDREIGDRIGQSLVRTSLATLLKRQGRHRTAIELLRQNVRAAPSGAARADMLHLLASALLDEQRRWSKVGEGQERLGEVVTSLDEAVNLLREDPKQAMRLGKVLVSKSKASQMIGDLPAAEEAARDALTGARERRDNRQLSYAENRLGWVLLARSEHEESQRAKESLSEAIHFFRMALEIAEAARDRRATIYQLYGLARASLLAKDFERTEESLERALDIVSSTHDPQAYALLVREMARLLRARGESERAKALLRDAYRIVKGMGSSSASRLLKTDQAADSDEP